MLSDVASCRKRMLLPEESFCGRLFFRDNQRRSDGLLDYKSTEWDTKAFYLQFPPCDTIWWQVRRKGNHLPSFSIWLGKLANVGSSPSKRQHVSLDAIREAAGRSCCQFPIQLLCVTNPILCPVGKTKFAVSSAGTAVDPLVIYGRLRDFVGVSISSIVRWCQLPYLNPIKFPAAIWISITTPGLMLMDTFASVVFFLAQSSENSRDKCNFSSQPGNTSW